MTKTKTAYAHNDHQRLNPLQVPEGEPVHTKNGHHFLLTQAEKDKLIADREAHRGRLVINARKEIRDKAWVALRESDWTMLSDAPFNTQKQAEWREYRNKLRAIYDHPQPETHVFPTIPN